MNQQTQQNLLKIVRQNYEEIADEFNQTRKKMLWPELLKLSEIVKDGDSVLDVGCGNGRLTSAFTDKKIKYLGVDSSANLIEHARKNFSVSNYEFLVGNILELDKITQNNFDNIFCVAVLQHLPGKDLQTKALEQMKHKLKPGGKLILVNWNLWSQQKYRKIILKHAWLKIIGQNQMDFGDILFNWKKGPLSQRYYHAFTKCELKKITKKAGLKIEKLYKDKYNYYLILTR